MRLILSNSHDYRIFGPDILLFLERLSFLLLILLDHITYDSFLLSFLDISCVSPPDQEALQQSLSVHLEHLVLEFGF